jgi:hypothetical protein
MTSAMDFGLCGGGGGFLDDLVGSLGGVGLRRRHQLPELLQALGVAVQDENLKSKL